MTEQSPRLGRVYTESATGVDRTTFYYLVHEGKRYPIPQEYVGIYILNDNTVLSFKLENGRVSIPETFNNRKYRRQ